MFAPHRSSIACWRRSSSPTSSARRRRRPALGDRRWRELLERHHAAVRRELERFRRPRGRHRRRRLLRHLRRARAGQCAARCAVATMPCARSGWRCGPGVHTGEVRAARRRRRRDRGAHRRTRVGAGGPGRGLVSSTVQGSRRRLRHRVRGPRRARAEGRSGLVAALRGGRLTGESMSRTRAALARHLRVADDLSHAREVGVRKSQLARTSEDLVGGADGGERHAEVVGEREDEA